jgi:hypothetical protein
VCLSSLFLIPTRSIRNAPFPPNALFLKNSVKRHAILAEQKRSGPPPERRFPNRLSLVNKHCRKKCTGTPTDSRNETSLEKRKRSDFHFHKEPRLVSQDFHRKPVWKPALRGVSDLSNSAALSVFMGGCVFVPIRVHSWLSCLSPVFEDRFSPQSRPISSGSSFISPGLRGKC